MTDTQTGTQFTVTPKALKRVLEIRAGEDDPESLALWVEIMGVRGADYAYDIYFQALGEADPGDEVIGLDGISVVIPSDSVDQLRGATLDMSRDLLNPGMVMKNPNQPPVQTPAGAVPLPDGIELTGDIAERVTQVLEHHINPSIAAHGGRADLAGVEDTVVYLQLSGGCQGCGQAQATLRQGIEVALRQAIPEITDVVDATDHAAGENPYY
jgi:Fe/S biogenesis protein NfuA